MIKNCKPFITIPLLFFCSSLYAQSLSGIVLDRKTLLPVPHTTVNTTKQTVSTSAKGVFTVNGLHKGDTIKITCVGYKYHYLVFSQPITDTIRIYLEQTVTTLNSVVIIGKRPSNTDSIKLRKEFAPVFNYQGTTFKDIFITHAPYVYKPDDHITSANNMTTLLSVNLLSVLDLLNKNNAPVSKLQQTLLKDEQDEYIDRVFSRQKVMELTHLKGDSLQNFMDKYRPSSKVAHTMGDYDAMIYIKKCYAEFEKKN